MKKKPLCTTTNIVHLADSVKMKMIEINKHSRKLKIKCFKMPNAPYLNRWQTFKNSR
jgi:hypothetical protein